MSRRDLVVLCLLGWLKLTWSVAGAEPLGSWIDSVGARAGFSSNARSSDFHQADAFVDFRLPWQGDLGQGWGLGTRLDCSAGWMGAKEDDLAVMSVGPNLVLGRERWPVSVDLGASPTLITRRRIEGTDFGTLLQFTSHAGVSWDVWAGVRVGYRFQHMSNASISYHNPGLNLHMFELSFSF